MELIELENPRIVREKQRKFAFDKGLKDAVGDYLRRRFPSNTAKMSAKAFSLSVDQARAAVGNNPSLATIERIFKKGGWPAVVSIMADVLGTSITQYLIELREIHEQHAKRFGAVVTDLWPVHRPRASDPDILGDEASDGLDTERRRMGL